MQTRRFGTLLAYWIAKEFFWREPMSVSVDRVFGIHAEALKLRARRGELLASNLVNADTPGYKARDLDFKGALQQVRDGQAVTLSVTEAGHMASQGGIGGAHTLYRIPNQPSLDGNSVDAQVEQTKFAENAVRYRASLRFLNGRIQGLMAAIRGD
jgi:flagellar basal-body rod protein FlgB